MSFHKICYRRQSNEYCSHGGIRTITFTTVTPYPSYYVDDSIVNCLDLGIRVVGGKRMANGELGAFVSAVNQAKYNQILGEVKEGSSTFSHHY